MSCRVVVSRDLLCRVSTARHVAYCKKCSPDVIKQFSLMAHAAELLLPAITRVAGIIGGVLLSLLLSVLLWPKSASEQAMR